MRPPTLAGPLCGLALPRLASALVGDCPQRDIHTLTHKPTLYNGHLQHD